MSGYIGVSIIMLLFTYMYDIHMEKDEFDVDLMMNALKSSSTYDEFRIKCDVNNVECIISREEYKHIRDLYPYQNEIDVTYMTM